MAFHFGDGVEEKRAEVRELTVVRYMAWGATEPTPLPERASPEPMQENISDLIVAELIAADPSMMRMSESLLALFATPEAERLTRDTFWLLFLEYFALIDGDGRMELYRKIKMSQYDEEENGNSVFASRNPGGVVHARNRRSSSLRSTGSSVFSAPGGRRKSIAVGSSGGKGGGGKKGAAGHGKHVELPDVNPPRHVVAPKDAWKIHVHVEQPVLDTASPSRAGSRGGSRGSQRSPTGSPKRSSSVASNASSRSGRAASVCEVMERSQDIGAAEANTLLDTLIEMPVDNYEGPVEVSAALAMLVDAEVVDDREAATWGSVSTVDEQSMLRQDVLRRAAVSLIRQEQDHMFGRMAAAYVSLFQHIKSVKRDIVLPQVPDALSRVMAGLLGNVLPYMRGDMSPQVKRLMKRRLTFWFHGVENGDVRKWAKPSYRPAVPRVSVTALNRVDSLRQTDSFATSATVGASASRSAFPNASNASLPHDAAFGEEASTPPLWSFGDTPKTAAVKPPPGRRRESVTFGATPLEVQPSVTHAPLTGGARLRNAMKQQKQMKVKEAVDLFANIQSEGSAYHEALNEMRKDMRTSLSSAVPVPTMSSLLSDRDERARADGAATARRASRAPAPPPMPETGSGSKTARGKEVRHVVSHRFAEDPRPPRWHELGKRRQARQLAHDTTDYFEQTKVSPFMQRYLEDHDTPCHHGKRSAMAWSLVPT
jgi:hypothetical protein